MRVGAIRASLLLHGARSLKEKRGPLKRIIAHLQQTYHVSVSEVDNQDLHQRSTLGIAVVASDGQSLHERLNVISEAIECNSDFQVLEIIKTVY